MTSNSVLWEQLAESEKREKILKQELTKVQNEVAAQDKVLERLRDEMKLEQIEKHKLIQFKTTKVKRLNHLESMARQMELLHSIDIDKVINSLAEKDAKLRQALALNQGTQSFMNEIYRVKKKEVRKARDQIAGETKLKEEAMVKVEELRSEIALLQGEELSTLSKWKDKIEELRDVAVNYKEQNKNLKETIREMQLEQLSRQGLITNDSLGQISVSLNNSTL